MAVLHEESAAIAAMDFDRYKATHVQDENQTRVELGVYGYRIYQGWEEVGGLMEDFMVGNELFEAVNRKENVHIKVNGNSAWLTCDNIWSGGSREQGAERNNLQIMFLEKVKGQWKISLVTFYTKPISGDGSLETFY
ncbi:MAG: hypothetical protein KAH12_08610 [Anaerolineales bacterium]|nr:hypothetical protein [Anaerolineales bacterium]